MGGQRAGAVKLHLEMSLDLEMSLYLEMSIDLEMSLVHKLQEPLMTGLILKLSRVTSSKPKIPEISREQEVMADGCNGSSTGSTAKEREDGRTSRLTPGR